MSEPFSIMIGNRSRFDAGDPGGYWLDMPATKDVYKRQGGMAARAVKGGIRRHKLKPYRAAAAAEKQAVKANADFLYQKALHDNPALAHSNPISRFWQKQRIKKQYAKTLKAGGKAKKTAEATAKAAKKTAQETKRATFFVVRHWKGCLIVGGIAFIVLLLFGGLSSCSLFGGNSGRDVYKRQADRQGMC